MNMRTVQAFFAPVAIALALSATAGLGLAMWLENGPALLLSLAQTGLAWCF
ncbi:hypothetical protein [Chelativorans sp. YIM 93263]|uniref:hypothetical protein n=1 Tax=Chelativorans sp. YIM 93263 TaxID=2906648 RepID=UPI002377F4FF|nr:hypothetical protein [Chelativorans sp. YIM 93263]